MQFIEGMKMYVNNTGVWQTDGQTELL